MRCLACNDVLSDKEAARKYPNHKEIKNPEDRYIGLCDPCIKDTDLVVVDDLDTVVVEEPDDAFD